jgi:hypothetical protein
MRLFNELTGGLASPAGNGGGPLASISVVRIGDCLKGLPCSSGASTWSIARFLELT